MKLYILSTLELLDILPLATLYAIYGLILYLGILFIYPIFLLYHLRKQKTTETKPTKSNAVVRWIKKASDSLIFTLYGTELADDRVKLFLEEERTNGVGSLEDAWKRVQLIWLALMLRLNAVSLLMLCGLALWDRFLIERSQVCDDEKICFVGSLDAVKDWNREPIKNCSNVTNIDEVVCFRFSYNLSDTIGLVGGILSFGIYSMRVGATVMIFLYKLLFRCRNKKANRIFASFLQQVPLCIMLITAAITVALVKVRDLTFYGTLIETFGIASTVALVLATPWSAFVNPLDTKFASKIEDIVDGEEAEKGVQNTL